MIGIGRQLQIVTGARFIQCPNVIAEDFGVVLKAVDVVVVVMLDKKERNSGKNRCKDNDAAQLIQSRFLRSIHSQSRMIGKGWVVSWSPKIEGLHG